MAASLILRAPKEGDDPLTAEMITSSLKEEGVLFGIDGAAIEAAINDKRFNEPIKVASGEKPQRGASASFVFHFDTTEDHRPKEGEDGHLDYKDISFIQNVEKGTVLATKVPPAAGRPGQTVLGKETKGPDGRDLPFKCGANCEVSEDGLKLVATANGAIQFKHGKVSINDVLVIPGHLDHSVGNIECLGSVRINGDVKAGYEIKVDGDLEVGGNFEESKADVGGSICVKGGCFGEGNGYLKAGHDIMVKFAEGHKIIAGNEVVVGGEIVNCSVLAGTAVHVKSGKGKIVGGDVSAKKVISAAVIGSDAGTATNVLVAFDHELMAKLHEVQTEIKRVKDDGKRVKEGLYALYRLQMDGTLTPDKQAVMDKLEKFQTDLPKNIEELGQQKKKLEDSLSENKDAAILVYDTLHPGVKASFGIIYREFIEPVSKCRLSLDGNRVMVSDLAAGNTESS